MDSLTKDQRSERMRRIRSRDTIPEKTIRSFLYQQGFRFRVCVRTLPGHPDIVLPKYKTIIQVRGCFWHGHSNCKIAHIPKSNIRFWKDKITHNCLRDVKNDSLLRELGWCVIVIWECEIKDTLLLSQKISRLFQQREAENNA